MGEAENNPADQGAAGADPPLTVERLADLQAGLLDDETAARVRRQVRADPEAAATLRALNQVRLDVAAVGADPSSAPEAPPEVIARITEALTSAGPMGAPRSPVAHSARPRLHPGRVVAGVAGFCAVLAAVGI